MGGSSSAVAPSAPPSPDASDVALKAARRARAMSLLSLGKGFGNFNTATSLGNKPDAAAVSYGLPNTSLLSGQFGDETTLNATGGTLTPDQMTALSKKGYGVAEDSLGVGQALNKKIYAGAGVGYGQGKSLLGGG